MDEIIIEEKRYVSSKRAAKITGYAKDYVGQLCREGRVPARLVGRGWYVLESAIQDHRFGPPTSETSVGHSDPDKIVRPVVPTASISSTWESPRYEAANEELLPSINRMRDLDTEQEAPDGPQQRIQDSWQAWFDKFESSAPAQESVQEQEEETTTETEEVAEGEPIEVVKLEEEISVPIHIYTPPPEELLPRTLQQRQTAEEEEARHVRGIDGKRRSSGRILATLRVAGALFALLFASLAVLGTGYLDTYILSNRQVSSVAGVIIYNK